MSNSTNTAVKIGTSQRVPTAQRQINQDTMKSIGFTTNIKVEDRAVTRQGLQGIVPKKETKTERRIQDKTYYVTLFKRKINEIVKEIFSMNNEISLITNDMTTYSNLNKTYEVLSKEVQNLEGELADYNLAGDKYRSMMKAEDIESVYNHIRLYNKKKRDESDSLYLEKAKRVEELQKIEFENQKIAQTVEQRLMDLEPEQKNEYEQLREENQQYIMKIYEVREEMARLNSELIEGENLLKSNQNKREAHKLKDNISQLLRKKEELELQTNESGLSVEELKQRLVNKYKEESQEKANIDKKIGDVKKVIDAYKKSVNEIEKEMKTNTVNENAKAADSISQKDKEYSQFIDNFNDIKKNHLKEIETKEEVIVALLEDVSEKIIKGTSPTQGTNPQSLDIKAKIKEKKEMIEKSASTLEEAKVLYDELQVKMKRFDGLEETLKKDIKGYRDKLETIHKEMTNKFDKVDQHKQFLKSDSKRMAELLKVLQSNKENYSKILTSLVLRSRSKNTQLEDNEIYKKMRDLEKKMQDNENFIHSLNTFIESKANENDYSQLLKECMEIQQEINNEIVKRY